MKEVRIFILRNCPYCQVLMKALNEEEFENARIEIIDEGENPEIAEQYDYYYVPTVYLDGVKIHEGVIDNKKAYEIVSVLK